VLRDALAIVLRDLAPEQREPIIRHAVMEAGETARHGPLMIARRGQDICGAAWGQLQPGKTAIFWVPQLVARIDTSVAEGLALETVQALEAFGVAMTQTLLIDRSAPIVPLLESAGFNYLADLLYLSGDALRNVGPPSDDLEFVAFHETQRSRLIDLLEQTYLDSHDCAAMNGKRDIDDVLDGYRGTGNYRPENWLIVREGARDVGALLLADEPVAGHLELIYMGVAPQARGRGVGNQIARQALRIAGRAGRDRVLLAVDAANGPALAMYGRAGYTTWDRRTVFVRFRGDQATKLG
jgi:ribosomal protein S18 acetylase RimI-like enzyme